MRAVHSSGYGPAGQGRQYNTVPNAKLNDVLGHDVPDDGYLALNATIALVSLSAERKGVAPPKWIKPVILLSIPWAVSIHTVTAFLYNGLPGRSLWLTAILAAAIPGVCIRRRSGLADPVVPSYAEAYLV